MNLDLEYSFELLKLLNEIYPKEADFMAWKRHIDDVDKFAAGIAYLHGHGLIDNRLPISGMENKYIFNGKVKITEKGVDFLRVDGGLTAILDVTTIKFHSDDLKMILEKTINHSEGTSEQKKSMIDSLRQLPADAIKHLVMKLLDKGVAALPALLLPPLG